MTVARLPRAALPVLAALAAVTVSALPASAAPALTPARAGEWWLSALSAPAAVRAAPQAGKAVTVAVLSTGVDASHPDLTGSVITGPDFSKTGRVPGGLYWGAEGTAVASLIAGHGHGIDDKQGITGVAPHARILSVQVTQEYDDPQDSDAAIMTRLPDAIAAGIRYAVGHGAAVIALPLDPGMLGTSADADPAVANGSAAERAAVSFAVAHGVLLVAPAGDNGAAGDAANYPAAYPGVIAVGATAQDGQLSPFTSQRSYVTLTAPGSGITPFSPQPFGPLTDPAAGLTVAAPGGGYDSLASTDMSAALATGVAALIRSSYPRLTVPEVTQALEQGAAVPSAAGQHAGSAAGGPAGWGHGELSAAAALAAAKVIAAAHPVAVPTTAASAASRPASAPARSVRPVPVRPQVKAAPADPGRLLRTLLIDLVIAAGALIIALIAAMTAFRLRRRPRDAARPAHATQAGYAGTHTRRPRPAQSEEAVRPPWPGSSAQSLGAGPAAEAVRGTGALSGDRGGDRRGDQVRAVTGDAASAGNFGGAAPRSVPEAARSWSGSAWSTSSSPAWPDTVAVPGWPAPAANQPPWGPALPTDTPPPPPELTPPWEGPAANFIPAPLPPEAPPARPTPNTGPMYVWNPAASTSPLRILDEDQDQ